MTRIERNRCRSRMAWLVSAMFVAAAPATTTLAQSWPHGGWARRGVTVMTQNLYYGAPLEPLMVAGNLMQVLVEVDTIWRGVHATDFGERGEAIADQIAAARPDLLGLQEAALWRIQSPGDILQGGTTPATDVAYDFVQILLAELAERGTPYRVVVSLDQMDAELPSITGDDIRLTDRDVILARADLPCGMLTVLRTDEGHFEDLVEIPVGGAGGPVVTLFRGWVAADVFVRGRLFRFLNAHLEDVPFVAIQEAQARELLAGPADVRLPVVLLGDFNSDAIGPGTDSYEILLAGGFVDAWSERNPLDPGATWGHAPDLRNPMPNLTQRLDLVLFRDRVLTRFRPVAAFVVGEELGDRTATGMWPSDHAGVVAKLRIRRWFWR